MQAGMAAKAWPHHRTPHQGSQQGRIGGGLNGREALGGIEKLGAESRRRLARLAAPQPRRSGFRVISGQGFGKLQMRCRQFLQGRAWPRHEIGKGLGHPR